MTKPFLTAEWRWLAMLNWRVDPALLAPFVPRGTSLDLFEGHALISLVGFRFLNTRVKGIAIPFHRDFDEVNLRFYVRAERGGEVRHGVTFIREVVPLPVVAWIARAAYDEPYVARAMRSEAPRSPADAPRRVSYAWRDAKTWSELSIEVGGDPALPAAGSEASFVSEHYWGYTRRRDGSTSEYRVTHQPWVVWPAKRARFQLGGAATLGRDFAATVSRDPDSAFLAEGSGVEVFKSVQLAE